jgi:hypothetical protein
LPSWAAARGAGVRQEALIGEGAAADGHGGTILMGADKPPAALIDPGPFVQPLTALLEQVQNRLNGGSSTVTAGH